MVLVPAAVLKSDPVPSSLEVRCASNMVRAHAVGSLLQASQGFARPGGAGPTPPTPGPTAASRRLGGAPRGDARPVGGLLGRFGFSA